MEYFFLEIWRIKKTNCTFWKKATFTVTSIYLNDGEKDAPEMQIETDMTEDEVKRFEEDWADLWNPDISKNEIWELLAMKWNEIAK